MTSPYLTASEAAAHVKAPSLKAFDHWVSRHGVSCVRRGRIRLFLKDTLDRALRNASMRTVRRAS